MSLLGFGFGGTLSYWRTHDGNEVDFIWQRGNRLLAVEAKSSPSWRPKHGKGLETLAENVKGKGTRELVAVYRGAGSQDRTTTACFPPRIPRAARGDFFS